MASLGSPIIIAVLPDPIGCKCYTGKDSNPADTGSEKTNGIIFSQRDPSANKNILIVP